MRPWLPVLLLILSTGCATRIGARSLPAVRADYNQAVARSSSEQMLLNLVRLRYGHAIQFLEPVSVVTTYSFNRNASISGNTNLNGENSFASIAGGVVGAGISATETPTITYTPLSGEDFVRQLAAPLPRDLLMLLVQGGWPAERLLPFAVSRIGSAAAPIIAAADDTSRFARIVDGLTTLQASGDLVIELAGPEPLIGLGETPVARTLLANLGLPEDTRSFTLSSQVVDPGDDEVPVRTRSMMDVLYYLSHGVEVSATDPAARDLGVPLPISEPLLHIQSGKTVPSTAYVAIPYQDRWFWIDDTDRSSKSVFGTLTILFNLMGAPQEARTPVLTLPR
ncbi:MAG: hypothetical protein AAGA48_33990 [Myxococcota bacterium]